MKEYLESLTVEALLEELMPIMERSIGTSVTCTIFSDWSGSVSYIEDNTEIIGFSSVKDLKFKLILFILCLNFEIPYSKFSWEYEENSV